MLERLSIPRYAIEYSRDNATGADNQQERLEDTFENPQRLYAGIQSSWIG